MWAVCSAAETPPLQPQPARAPPNAPQPQPSDVPDEEFIEFLGEDDHGDTAWWEFLKKQPPAQQDPATPPPRDPRQS